jgi:hypothetical protein
MGNIDESQVKVRRVAFSINIEHNQQVLQI